MAIIKRALLAVLAPLTIAVLAVSPVVADDDERDRDPFESFNRSVFAFNNTADTYVLRPVAKGYRAVTPQPIEKSISNAFTNLLEVNSAFNSVLQAKFGKATYHSGRFLINSTLGLVGLFDVAKAMGLSRIDGEDFGQTLAVWGVRSGPYLMLPLLGPSTVRDAPSRYVDRFLDPVTQHVDHIPTRNTLYATSLISSRAGLLRAEELISGDQYDFIREVYFQRRQHLIHDGLLVDDFGDDYDDFYDQDRDYEDDF